MARFRARARAVDLLGRQQIAGIPTAVHELLKNAHDAYADHVEVDFFRADRLFVLRDDGVGMTRDDFETRWLVVGTDSKVIGAKSVQPPPVDEEKPRRPVLGEKGIGRLAIGIIGNQVLVISRAGTGEVKSPVIAAFIHWEVFSLPGVDLDEIEVPVKELAEHELVDKHLVAGLVAKFQECIDRLLQASRITGDAHLRISKDLSAFKLDPWGMEPFLPGPRILRLSEGHRGTQFWVYPANEILDADLATDTKTASPMEEQLIGFANTMTPHAAEPVLAIAFRDHRSGDDIRDIVSPEIFFTPAEFLNADHFIHGEVDEFGQFVGTVSIFGERRSDFRIPFHDEHGKKLACGPFSLYLAYVQGVRKESTLPDAEWFAFAAKTERFGGVYVYSDGIRVLPYGNPDFDWLEIEERRSKHATFYFFSHRRMCGAVLLTRAENANVREKAGREGFQRNTAYRQLQQVLQTILLRLAAEFFRAEEFQEKKRDHARQRDVVEKRLAQARPKRKKFSEDLAAVVHRIETGDPESEAALLREFVTRRVEAALERDDEGLAAYLLEVERESRESLHRLRQSFQVPKPRVSLTKELDRLWRRYSNFIFELERRIFEPLELELDRTLGEAVAVLVAEPQHYERLRSEVATEARMLVSDVEESRRTILKELDRVGRVVREGVTEKQSAVTAAVLEAEARVPGLAKTLTDVEAYRQARDELVSSLVAATVGPRSDLVRMVTQLRSLAWSEESDLLEQLTAVEQEMVTARERVDEELEAAQLGMAVEIISHEFDHYVADVRALLRRLGAWADANPKLGGLVRDLSAAFEHLDSYLALLAPLRRRLSAAPTRFAGAAIENYVRRIFENRFANGDIELVATAAFQEFELDGQPSVYFPVFVNLIDNAIWWLQDRSERRITLDARADALFVRDSGPGVASSDGELIFERGFSLKPGGRGLGLTISRDSIRRIGGDITVEDSTGGAVFKVRCPRATTPSDEET